MKKLFRYRWLKRLLYGLGSLLFVFICLNFIFPLTINVRYSQLIVDRDGHVLNAFLSADDKWRMYSEIDEISPKLRRAIVYKEDKFFFYHFGINPFSIGRAAFNNLIYHKRTSGASTITMQVARLLYPQKRTYLNKAIESFRALQLELTYSKSEILQLYFNLVPYGGNIEGVKAASLLYFGCSPEKLSLAQITALAVIPNRPVSMQLGKNTDSIVKFRNRWLDKMEKSDVFNSKEIQDAKAEPLVARRVSLPNLAPHLAQRIHSTKIDQPIVKTTLQQNNQQKVSAITYNYSKRLKSMNIHNAAVVVVDNKTHELICYVGSQDFFDNTASGQVDGVRALRSPGSALKPLVYAIGFDKGVATPKTIMTDVPVNFDGYAPVNYNSTYNGNVTVENSLSQSLNVPAVKMLNMVGVGAMLDKLKLARFSEMKASTNKFGLSLALGACGVRLEEMAGLYSAFANNGQFTPLHYLSDDTVSTTVELVSPASAYMLSDILSTLTRPDFPGNVESSMHLPRIAWKTGTSYGRRDAWSIGYNKQYTVAVWIGNFDNTGVPEISGAEIATPLLFQVFNVIGYNSKDWFTEPDDLDYRLVCSESGKVPDEFCNKVVIDYFIPTVSNSIRCDHMKKVFVAPDEKFSYCTSCLPSLGYKEKLYFNISPELIAFYDNERVSYQKIPPHNNICTRVFTEHAPRITSPVNNKEYTVEKGEGELLLSCNVANEVKTVYWYVNNRLIKSCSASEKVFFQPTEGKIKISCSDDKGRNADQFISVKYF